MELNKDTDNLEQSSEAGMVTLMFDLSTGAMVPSQTEKPPNVPESKVPRSSSVVYCTEAEWDSIIKVGWVLYEIVFLNGALH